MNEQHMLVNNKINFLQAIRRYLASYIDSWVCTIAIFSAIFAIAIIPAVIIAKQYNIDLSYYLSKEAINSLSNYNSSDIGIIIASFIYDRLAIFIISVVLFLIAWFFLDILGRVLMLYWFGNTLGKKLFSLQILAVDNSPLTFKRLWKREFKKSIFVTLWFIVICIIMIPIIVIIKLLPKINKLHTNSEVLTYTPNAIEGNSMWLEQFIVVSIIVLLLYAYLNFRNNIPYWDKALNTIVIHKKLKWYGISLMVILPICIIFGTNYWFKI